MKGHRVSGVDCKVLQGVQVDETGKTYLGLDGLPASLLSNLLSNTLLVHSSVDLGPCDLSRVLSLEEEGLGLVVEEPEDLFDGRVAKSALCFLGQLTSLLRSISPHDLFPSPSCRPAAS